MVYIIIIVIIINIKCIVCASKTEIAKDFVITSTVQGREIVITGLTGDRCPECGEQYVDTESSRKALKIAANFRKPGIVFNLTNITYSPIYINFTWANPPTLITWELGNETEVGDSLNVTPRNCISSIYRYNTTSKSFEKSDTSINGARIL